jgi:putative ABC transport system ATP-binding protein
MAAAILAKDLSKVYNEGQVEVKAVSSVSLEVKEGEIIGLFGPSGSGKTTLLSMIGCILRPTSGSLKLFGTETSSMSEKELPLIRKKYVSFIFQGFNLFPALTAFENVMIILKLKGSAASSDKKALDLLALVGLSDRINFLPKDLSGGQKQRVAIARSLAADAPLIIADEPTGNLDHVNGRNVMEILRSLAVEQKKCVIVATHDTRIEDIFDRSFIMEDGRIITEKRKTDEKQ